MSKHLSCCRHCLEMPHGNNKYCDSAVTLTTFTGGGDISRVATIRCVATFRGNRVHMYIGRDIRIVLCEGGEMGGWGGEG